MKTEKRYSNKNIKELEALAMQGLNDIPAISEFTLMQRAGTATFALLIKKFPKTKEIAIFCGAGNNAGDGYVLAALAKKAGMDVTCYYLKKPDTLKQPAILAYALAKKAEVIIIPFDKSANLDEVDLLVDALLGTGIQGNLKKDYLQAIQQINSSKTPILAIDVPSGLNADTGEVINMAVRANTTITFIGIKQGFKTPASLKHCGELHLNTLGLDDRLYEMVNAKER